MGIMEVMLNTLGHFLEGKPLIFTAETIKNPRES